MHQIVKVVLIFALSSLGLNATAQLAALFAPFDCREHAELFHNEPVVYETIIIDSSLLIAYEEELIDSEFSEGASEWTQWTFAENYSFGKNRGSLPMVTDLKALHPYFRDKVYQLISICKAKGIELQVVETYRTHAKQNEYKSMGKAYTNSTGGKSKHQYGLAVDVVPLVKGVPVWDNAFLWKRIGLVGEKLGLRWGGRWRRPYDPGHFEWTGGLTSIQLSHGLFPTVPNCNLLYPCLEEDLEVLKKHWTDLEATQSSLTKK